jgi:nitroreductase
MTAPLSEATKTLEAAARASLRAPSVFNTQPWSCTRTGTANSTSSTRTAGCC